MNSAEIIETKGLKPFCDPSSVLFPIRQEELVLIAPASEHAKEQDQFVILDGNSIGDQSVAAAKALLDKGCWKEETEPDEVLSLLDGLLDTSQKIPLPVPVRVGLAGIGYEHVNGHDPLRHLSGLVGPTRLH
jgi:hypothetical protein